MNVFKTILIYLFRILFWFGVMFFFTTEINPLLWSILVKVFYLILILVPLNINDNEFI